MPSLTSWCLALAIALGFGSAQAAPPRESLDAFIARYAKAHDFSGVIAVRGAQRYARAFGLANRAFKVPNALDTRFKIASITKAFTAVLILQLRDEGKLALDATIGTYLPSYRGPARDKVTIHQLLDHTSGLDNFDKLASVDDAVQHGMPAYQLPHAPDELMAQFASGPVVHPPGTAFDYNNGDYVILGKIIEQVAGAPYEQVLAQRILAPLRLRDTGVARQEAIIERLAETYFQRDGKTLGNDLPVYPENWYAAGAMYSTAADLFAFAQALFAGKLCSADALARMIKPGLDDYGYGVWSYDTKVRGASYHVVKRPGRIMGAQSQLFHVMAPDLTIVILANTDRTDLDELAAEIGKHALP